MTSSKIQPLHMVDESPWPFLLGISTFWFFLRFVRYFYGGGISFFLYNFLLQIIILSMWRKDIIRESNYMGIHNYEIRKIMKWGFAWFITSEVIFFFGFFWAFFHNRLSPNIEVGGIWPPLLIEPMSPFAVPLLNTLILLRRGVSLTWAHHSLIGGHFIESLLGLLLTISLGIYFTSLQIFEYLERIFSFNDSSYGRIFFLATGFHGFHVFIGTIILIIVAIRIYKNQFSLCHHFGVEFRSWYWHFVDVVWLFLFCCIYWWGC